MSKTTRSPRREQPNLRVIKAPAKKAEWSQEEINQAIRRGGYKLACAGQYVTFNPEYYSRERTKERYVVLKVFFDGKNHSYKILNSKGKLLTDIDTGRQKWHANAFVPFYIAGEAQFTTGFEPTKPRIS